MKYLITILISFIFASFVYAENIIDNQCVVNTDPGAYSLTEPIAVAFNPRHNNISRIESNFFTSTSTLIHYEIYEGTPQTDANCENLITSDDFLLAGNFTISAYATNSTPFYQGFDLDLSIDESQPHYVVFSLFSGFASINATYITDGSGFWSCAYYDRSATSTSGNDYAVLYPNWKWNEFEPHCQSDGYTDIAPKFRVYYSDNFTSSSTSYYQSPYLKVQVGSEYLQYEREKICFVGEPCYLRVNFPYSLVGDQVKLYEMVDNQIATSSLIESYTVEDKYLIMHNYTLPSQSTSTKLQYCLRVVRDDVYAEDYCDISVWWSNETLMEILGVPGYDLNEACEEVATATPLSWSWDLSVTLDSFAENIRYGVECGFNKVAYWSFHPRDGAYNSFLELKNDATNSFPFNIFLSLWRDIMEISQNEDGIELTIPIYVGELGNGTSSIAVLSADTLNEKFPVLWPQIYELMNIIIFLLTASYFIFWFVGRIGETPNLSFYNDEKYLRRREYIENKLRNRRTEYFQNKISKRR